MVFSSTIFVIWFLPIFLFVYYGLFYIAPAQNRIAICNGILLIASFIFYAWDTPKFLLVMLLSIILNFTIAFVMGQTKKIGIRKVQLVVGVTANLLLLGYFKYFNFLIDTVSAILKKDIINVDAVMPIGISFFTFQGLSYIVDVYQETVEAQKNPLKVALYISMFPQLIAGPIVRYDTICKQIDKRIINIDNLATGSQRFVFGLAKKLLIANILGKTADQIFEAGYFGITHMSMSVAWCGAICYTMQIYFDFSAYSDMAIGLGRMLGFHFLENFNYPYISKSITEFWRRWHMSLSSFFRDYVYIPMGGNRRGNVYIHLTIVFLLTGLWHGASWTFVIWGLWHGCFILLEKKIKNLQSFNNWGGVYWIKNIYVMLIVVIGWIIFRIERIDLLSIYLKVMFGLVRTDWVQYQIGYYMDKRCIFVLCIAVLLSYGVHDRIKEKINLHKFEWEIGKKLFTVLLFLVCIIVMANSEYNPFIYFRF